MNLHESTRRLPTWVADGEWLTTADGRHWKLPAIKTERVPTLSGRLFLRPDPMPSIELLGAAMAMSVPLTLLEWNQNLQIAANELLRINYELTDKECNALMPFASAETKKSREWARAKGPAFEQISKHIVMATSPWVHWDAIPQTTNRIFSLSDN